MYGPTRSRSTEKYDVSRVRLFIVLQYTIHPDTRFVHFVSYKMACKKTHDMNNTQKSDMK